MRCTKKPRNGVRTKRARTNQRCGLPRKREPKTGMSSADSWVGNPNSSLLWNMLLPLNRNWHPQRPDDTSIGQIQKPKETRTVTSSVLWKYCLRITAAALHNNIPITNPRLYRNNVVARRQTALPLTTRYSLTFTPTPSLNNIDACSPASSVYIHTR